MPPALQVRAHAKVNLDLRVGARRADGYHDIATVFQSLALHDVITVEPTDGPLVVSCSDARVPGDADNLCGRAVVRLWHACGRAGDARGIRVHIEKHIPVAGGLGGGSSDTAAVLRALARLWSLDVAGDPITHVAAGLGADVPYFLRGGTALGVGRGDQITPLADLTPAEVVLVQPPFGLSTGDVYRWADELDRGRADTGGFARRPGADVACRNDLERAVLTRHPELQAIVNRLRACGARLAAMTGSGSTVFGLFDRATPADEAAGLPWPPGARVLRTRTISAAVYQQSAEPVHGPLTP